MANALFDSAREAYLAGDLAFDTDDVREILVDTGTDDPDTAADDFLDDITAGARISVSSALTSKTVTDGTADAADTTHSSVTGNTVEEIVHYEHTGVEGTSHLITRIDTASSGLPLTPNGGDVTTQYNASGIFTL